MTVHVLDPSAIEKQARRAAGWLEQRGVRSGDRIAILADNHPRLLALTHGALRTGIIPVLIGSHLAPEERTFMIEDCDPAVVVDNVDAVQWSSAPQADLAPLPLGKPMFYTSGSTGRPKGVWGGVLDEDGARAWAGDEDDLWAPVPERTWLVCSPLHHSAGHRSATAALLKGCRVLLLDRFDAATVVELLRDEPVGGAFLVPTHLRRIFALGDPPPARAPHRFLHAGEVCPEPLKRRTLLWLGDVVWEFYGSTEGQFTAISPDEWRERPGSVGRARRERTLTIRDAATDGVGTVFVSAPPFARWEYWRDPKRTTRAWRGDAFTAGDLGSVDDDGYLTLASRRTDLVISGGVNVYPAMVERALLEHPGVHEVVVFGVPDDEWGERVCAAIVADDAATVEAFAAERLRGPMRPKQLVFLTEIPRTPRGKVNRAALAELLA